MTLLSYKEFQATRESTAVTRAKRASALGQMPPSADVFGHDTPPSWEVKKLIKQKRTNSPTAPASKEPLQEREMHPDYSFDRLVRKAAAASQEIDNDIEKAEKEADQLDKEKERKEKHQPKRPVDKKDQEPDSSQPDEEDKDKDQEQDKEEDQDQKSPLTPKKPLIKGLLNKKPLPPIEKHEKLRETEVAEWLNLLGNTSFDSRQ